MFIASSADAVSTEPSARWAVIWIELRAAGSFIPPFMKSWTAWAGTSTASTTAPSTGSISSIAPAAVRSRTVVTSSGTCSVTPTMEMASGSFWLAIPSHSSCG